MQNYKKIGDNEKNDKTNTNMLTCIYGMNYLNPIKYGFLANKIN